MPDLWIHRWHYRHQAICTFHALLDAGGSQHFTGTSRARTETQLANEENNCKESTAGFTFGSEAEKDGDSKRWQPLTCIAALDNAVVFLPDSLLLPLPF